MIKRTIVSNDFFKKLEYKGRLYKYLNKQSARLTLNNSTLFLQSPNNFNDPYDCYEGLIHFPDSKQHTINLMHKKLDNLSKYQKKIIEEKIINGEMDTDKQFSEFLLEIKNEIGVTCFSKNFDNILMWSHYAEKHSSICLGFEINLATNDYFAVPVDYVKKFKKANYGKEGVTMLKKWLFTKAHDWKYEEEVRLISFEKSGVISFKKKALKEIIFGANIKKEFKEEISKIIKEKKYNVTMSEMRMNENE